MSDFFTKLQARRTVLKRTTKRKDMPSEVLYVGMLQGQKARQVLDMEGNEHAIDDLSLQSNYKLEKGSKTKTLIETHWKEHVAKPGEPIRKAE